MERKKVFKILAVLIILIFAVNLLANKLFWYSLIWWFDMPMHFVGGFWLGLLFLYISPGEEGINWKSRILKLIFFVLFIGLGWEIFEAIVNEVIVQNPFNYLDTLSDIFFDLSGGLCAILYIWRKQLS